MADVSSAVWYGHRMMIFGFLPENLKTQAVAVAFSMAWQGAEVEPGGDGFSAGAAGGFRWELYGRFSARDDALFELADALLCADGPVKTLPLPIRHLA